jgi:hypothetical protein
MAESSERRDCPRPDSLTRQHTVAVYPSGRLEEGAGHLGGYRADQWRLTLGYEGENWSLMVGYVPQAAAGGARVSRDGPFV